VIELRNGRTRVTLDKHGSIQGIIDIKTGHAYFDAIDDDRRLFHLVVSAETWSSRPASSHESAPPVPVKDDNGCVLQYPNLKVCGKETGINAEVRFSFPAGTDEIQFSLKLRNEGKETITGAIFPWLNGWKSPGDSSLDRIMLGPVQDVAPASLPKWTMAWGNGTFAQQETVKYPDSVMVPWIDISGEKGGVSCINYQRKPRMCFAAVKNMAGHDPGHRPGVLWGFYAYVPPGHEWESPVLGISVHDGDWHRTADRYREWMNTWFTPAVSSRGFRESIGAQHVFFTYFDGTPFRSYDTLPEVAAVGRKYGVRELCVWDRLSLGTYGSANSPSEDLLQYSSEDRKILSGAVRKAVKEGTDVSALVNFRLVNPSLEVFKNENLISEVQTALDGTTRVFFASGALIPGLSTVPHLGPYDNVLSPFSEKYRQRVLRQIQDYLDLGYTSLFYDQPFEFYPDYSRKDNGGSPEMTYAKTLELIREVRDKLRENNPDAVILGEQCDVFGSEVIDQWMSWVWSARDIESAVRLHYSLPQTVINCVVDREPGLASHAFAAGFHLFIMIKGGTGTLSDAPEFAEHVKKLADLRKHCAARTVHARFNDVFGFTLESGDGIVAYSYDSPSGPAVIVAAPEKAGTARVTLDRAAFSHPGNPESGQVIHLDGGVTQVNGDTLSFSLDKYEVRVWIA